MRERGVYCQSCQAMHWTGAWPRECVEARRNTKRGSVPVPYIRSDGIDPILNHANGLMYDSRSAYERAVKDAGCVIVGNDLPEPSGPPEEITDTDKSLERDIVDTIQQLEARL